MSQSQICLKCGFVNEECMCKTDDNDTTNDPTNPEHYKTDGLECIDAIRAALGEDGFLAFCRGNAIKYAWRATLKAHHNEDMRKARWYASMAAGDDPRPKKENT